MPLVTTLREMIELRLDVLVENEKEGNAAVEATEHTTAKNTDAPLNIMVRGQLGRF